MLPSVEHRPFWSRSVFALVGLPVLAFLFNWPYLTGGFQADDIIFLNLLEQDPLPFSRWRGLWSTDDLPAFNNLWWKDPDFGGSFWRPLPSIVIEGSINLFGKNAFPLHFTSIVLHACVAVSLYLLVRALSSRHGLALLAGLFFVACEDHSMGVGWIATITDLLCVQFILLALLAHAGWLRRRRPVDLVFSLVLLAAAMACKETAAIAPVAMVLLTFFMPTGSDNGDFPWPKLGQRMARAIKDPLSWLPALLILFAYLAMYKGLRLGSMNSLMYMDPLAYPRDYLAHIVLHLPVMWLATLSPIPPSAAMFFPESLLPMALVGIAAFAAWLAALYPFRHRALALWALALYLVALLPQMGTDASERGLYFPMIPASILLAFAVLTIAPLARRTIPKPPPTPRWTRLAGWTAVLGILVPGIILSAIMPWTYLPSLSKPERELRTALPHIEEHQPEHILILNTSGFMLTLYTWDILNNLTDEPQDVWLLSAANGIFSLQRSGEAAFVIRTDRSGWLTNMFARLTRTEPELNPERRYEKPPFTASFLELTEDGSDVLAVQFELNRSLDDAGWLFLRWDGEGFEPLDIAAFELGETVALADTSDLWKAMN